MKRAGVTTRPSVDYVKERTVLALVSELERDELFVLLDIIRDGAVVDELCEMVHERFAEEEERRR